MDWQTILNIILVIWVLGLHCKVRKLEYDAIPMLTKIRDDLAEVLKNNTRDW